MNSDKIILDLCGGTGSWSKPYKDAGYDVRVVTLPDNDVLAYEPPENVYGILAAPPCTDFSVSGAQYWKTKDQDGRTIQSMSVVIACLKIIAMCRPKFWALENPVGRLKYWMGTPKLKFNPCDYGDTWTKKTYLWGSFLEPGRYPVKPVSNANQTNCISWPRDENRKSVSWNSPEAKELRSITPPGFAKAFFEANQ